MLFLQTVHARLIFKIVYMNFCAKALNLQVK